MQCPQRSARVIHTGPGGLRKEACYHQVPCITLRNETEWVGTVHSGWNQLLGADQDRTLSGFSQTGKLTVANGRPYGKVRPLRKTVLACVPPDGRMHEWGGQAGVKQIVTPPRENRALSQLNHRQQGFRQNLPKDRQLQLSQTNQ